MKALANEQLNISINTAQIGGINPGTPLSQILTNGFRLIFIVAALTVVIFVVWGAFEYITSGGDVDKTKKAREKITMALIGLAVLAFSFFFVSVVGQLVGFNNIFAPQTLPTLQGACPPGATGPNCVVNPSPRP